MPKPKFKVGDRIRVKEDFVPENGTGVIVNFLSETTVRVKWDAGVYKSRTMIGQFDTDWCEISKNNLNDFPMED